VVVCGRSALVGPWGKKEVEGWSWGRGRWGWVRWEGKGGDDVREKPRLIETPGSAEVPVKKSFKNENTKRPSSLGSVWRVSHQVVQH